MSLLRAEGITVRFGALVALDGVDIVLEEGRATGIIGPNGAGKTTLLDVLTGGRRPDAGTVTIDGRDVTSARPHRRARLGLGRTFQRSAPFGSLTVFENVLVAAEICRRWSPERRPPRAVADGVLAQLGLAGVADRRADDLPIGLARRMELGRALAAGPRVLLVDEPAAGLDPAERDDLGQVLRTLVAAGLAVGLVDHDVELVMGVCGQVHVLDFGRTIALGPPARVRTDSAVQAAYLGAGAG